MWLTWSYSPHHEAPEGWVSHPSPFIFLFALIITVLVTVKKIPFRMVLRERRPIVVEVSIRNTASRERKYVVSVDSGRELSLSPTGLARFDSKKTGNVFPGESTVVAFKIYPRATTRSGEHVVMVTVEECVDDYSNVIRVKEIPVRVPVI